MSTIGKNIKKIRIVKKMSQAQFAELFDLARPSVGAYEEGRSEPKIDNVIQIARYFGISIDRLLTKELTINDLYKFELRTKELTKNRKIEEEYSSASVSAIDTVVVPGDKQFEYIVQLNNKDFILSLPRILIPGFDNTNFRAFEVTTSESYAQYHGVNQGDLLIGEKVHNHQLQSFVADKLYVLVLEKGIMVRRVEAVNKELNLTADGPDIKNFKIKSSHILEAWEIKGFFSTHLKQALVVSERITYLESTVGAIEKRLKQMEQNSRKS